MEISKIARPLDPLRPHLACRIPPQMNQMTLFPQKDNPRSSLRSSRVPYRDLMLFKMAERPGFEPGVGFYPYNRLAICRLQPLGHLSA